MAEPIRLFDDATASSLEEALRIAEALLFAATEPLSESTIAARLASQIPVLQVLDRLHQHYASRGINLVRVDGKWALRTAADLGWLLQGAAPPPRKLSRAAMETLAIIAYHQPVTRAEIEDIRGVALARGVLDVLLEAGWVRLRGRRKTPGRPLTFGTTGGFLDHFGLNVIAEMPNLDDLRGTGFLTGRLPKRFAIPAPNDCVALGPDEVSLEDHQDVEDDQKVQDDQDAQDGMNEDVAGQGADPARHLER